MKQNKFYIDEGGFLRHAQTGLTVNTQQAVNGCDCFEESVLACIQDTVRHRMTAEAPSGHGLVEEAVAGGSVFISKDHASRPDVLVLVSSKRSTPPGVWSRGVCLSFGLGVGSMLPAIAAAQQQQYAVIVVQPPCPSQAEAFIEAVWDTYLGGDNHRHNNSSKLNPTTKMKRNVCFLALNEGAVLVQYLVRARASAGIVSSVGAALLVEPGRLLGKYLHAGHAAEGEEKAGSEKGKCKKSGSGGAAPA